MKQLTRLRSLAFDQDDVKGVLAQQWIGRHHAHLAFSGDNGDKVASPGGDRTAGSSKRITGSAFLWSVALPVQHNGVVRIRWTQGWRGHGQDASSPQRPR